MVEEEHDTMAQELNQSSNQLIAKRARADMAKASLVVTSASLEKSIVNCAKVHHLLAKA